MTARMSQQERLRRLLFLVPFVARNPGLPVSEVAAALGLTKEQLLEELDLLTLVGRPPFQPDDFVDIYVEDDKVYLELDQRLSAPPRLTATEGAALAAAAGLLAPASSETLGSAISKLEKVLPEAALARFREMKRRLDLKLEAPAHLADLSRAILERKEVTLDYFGGAKGTTEQRAVRPYELFSHRGQWYLQAFCCSRSDVRLFRLDRIQKLELGHATFEPQVGAGPSRLPELKDSQERVKVRFSAAAAPYVRERFGDDAKWVEGGALEVEVPGDSERWLTQWILSFGGEARVIEPPTAVKAVARAARASLES